MDVICDVVYSMVVENMEDDERSYFDRELGIQEQQETASEEARESRRRLAERWGAAESV